MIKWMKEKRDLLPAPLFWQQARIRYAPRTKESLQSILDKEEEDVRSYVRTYVRTHVRTYVRTYAFVFVRTCFCPSVVDSVRTYVRA